MPSRLAVCLALALTLPLLAREPRIDPPAPDSTTPIRISFFDMTCGFPIYRTAVFDSRIRITFDTTEGGCIPELTPQLSTVRVDPLPHGVYSLHVQTAGYGTYDATVVVRQAGAIDVAPYAAPTTGGTPVTLTRTDGGLFPRDSTDPATVFFGSQTVEAQPVFNTIHVHAPPASVPDVVDIGVSAGGDQQWLQRTSFIYFDPTQPPNRTAAEPILFPIAYDGPGAFGSQWRTDNRLQRAFSSDIAPVFFTPPCDGCGDRADTSLTLPPMQRPDGATVWVLRGSGGENVVVHSSIRDVSRSAENAGTAVPVVRERDFRTAVSLGPLPVDPRYRIVLRVWSLEPADVYINGSKQLTTRVVTPGNLPFASLDLTALFAGGATPAGLNIHTYSALGIWPMISVTNNETQQVTIIAPQ